MPEVHGAADWMAAPTMHAVAACYGMEWLGLQQPAMAWSGGAGGGARHVRRLGEVVRGTHGTHGMDVLIRAMCANLRACSDARLQRGYSAAWRQSGAGAAGKGL